MKVLKITQPVAFEYQLEFCCNLSRAHADYFKVKSGNVFITLCPFGGSKVICITHCPFCGAPVEVH